MHDTKDCISMFMCNKVVLGNIVTYVPQSRVTWGLRALLHYVYWRTVGDTYWNSAQKARQPSMQHGSLNWLNSQAAIFSLGSLEEKFSPNACDIEYERDASNKLMLYWTLMKRKYLYAVAPMESFD